MFDEFAWNNAICGASNSRSRSHSGSMEFLITTTAGLRDQTFAAFIDHSVTDREQNRTDKHTDKAKNKSAAKRTEQDDQKWRATGARDDDGLERLFDEY